MSIEESFNAVYQIVYYKRCKVFMYPTECMELVESRDLGLLTKFCSVLPGLYHYVYCYVRSLKSYFLTRGLNNNGISQIY